MDIDTNTHNLNNQDNYYGDNNQLDEANHSQSSILDEDNNDFEVNNNPSDNLLFETNINNNLIENKVDSDFFNLKNGNFAEYLSKFGDGNKLLLKNTSNSNFLSGLGKGATKLSSSLNSNEHEQLNKVTKTKKEEKLFVH